MEVTTKESKNKNKMLNTQTQRNKVRLSSNVGGHYSAIMKGCNLNQTTIAEWEIYFEKHESDNHPMFGIGEINHRLNQRVGYDGNVQCWGLKSDNDSFYIYESNERIEVSNNRIGVKTGDKLIFEFNGPGKTFKVSKNHKNNTLYEFKNIHFTNQNNSYHPICSTDYQGIVSIFQNFTKI